MASHTVQSDRGEFEVVVSDEGTIVDVVGNWPEAGEEFTLEAPIPEHKAVQGAPEQIQAKGKESGWGEVCYYDDVHCQTCYCDGKGRMRCFRHC